MFTADRHVMRQSDDMNCRATSCYQLVRHCTRNSCQSPAQAHMPEPDAKTSRRVSRRQRALAQILPPWDAPATVGGGRLGGLVITRRRCRSVPAVSPSQARRRRTDGLSRPVSGRVGWLSHARRTLAGAYRLLPQLLSDAMTNDENLTVEHWRPR